MMPKGAIASALIFARVTAHLSGGGKNSPENMLIFISKLAGLRVGAHVSFSPKATELLRGNEMTWWAIRRQSTSQQNGLCSITLSRGLRMELFIASQLMMSI
jgi:hypothetical protein